MKSAINILKMSFENLKSEFLRKESELKESQQLVDNLKEEIDVLLSRMSEIDEAIIKLNKRESNVANKNKKTE